MEGVFNTLKRFRRIAPRCETTFPNVAGFVHLVGSMNWSRRMRTGPGARAQDALISLPKTSVSMAKENQRVFGWQEMLEQLKNTDSDRIGK